MSLQKLHHICPVFEKDCTPGCVWKMHNTCAITCIALALEDISSYIEDYLERIDRDKGK